MTSSQTLKDLLLVAGAVDMSESTDYTQPLFDFIISNRHRLHIAFDADLTSSQTATLSLLTIDGPFVKQGDNISGLDIHRVGVYPIDELVTFLQNNGPSINTLLPLKSYQEFL